MRYGVVAVVTLSVAAFAVLPGCALTDNRAPASLTDAEREVALDRYYDGRWERLQAVTPGLERPTIERVEVVDDDEWVERMEACVGQQLNPPEPNGFQVALLACQEQYPSRSMFESLRSDAQLDYLYDYNVKFLEPCLQFAGLRVPDAPTREDFFASGGYNWYLYQGDYETTGKLKTQLMLRCPPPLQ